VTYDGAGKAISYRGPVQWVVRSLDASTTETGTTATFVVAPTASTNGAVAASVGGQDCSPAEITLYRPADVGMMRVVVVSVLDNTPIADTAVVLDNMQAKSNSSGIALFDVPPGGRHTVSAFATDYAYVTVVDTTATDILLPLPPRPNPGTFVAQLRNTDFDNVANVMGTLHGYFCGPSIAGNLYDVTPSSLLEPQQPVVISLGTGTPYGPFNIPGCLGIGLGAQMFGDSGGGHIALQATPGTRALWALGGNAVIGDVLKAIGPVLNGGGGTLSDQLPTIVTALMPLVQRIESGVMSGVAVTAGETKPLSIGGAQPSLLVDTLERLHLNVRTPKLIQYVGDDAAITAFDGVFVIGGAMVPSQGFVPLGVAAGFDASGPDGVPDQVTDGATFVEPQHVPMRLAPRHGGIESSPWVFLTLAGPLTKLLNGTGELALSATVSYSPGTLRYNGGAASDADLSAPLLPVPDGATIDESSRLLHLPDVAGATFHQLDLGPREARWTVYFPAGETTVSVPIPPAGMEDRFAGAMPPAAVIKAVRLGYGTTTYDDVWQFDDVNANDLTKQTDAFSVRGITRSPAPTP
jgi:hypothetical protein